MKLFLRIYSHLLMGIIVLLAIDSNINYELEISQFENDMKRNALQVGRIVSGMISHSWSESGPEAAIQLIDDANDANHSIHIRWIWLDELPVEHPDYRDEIQEIKTLDDGRSVTFVKEDELNGKYRHTFVPVSVPGARKGALELTQSLAPLFDYTRRTLIRSLVITGLLALISGIIIYFFIHTKIRGPLDRLSKKAVQIGKGNITPDLEIRGKDELTELARTMNDMCNRLIIAQQKNHFEHEARIKTLEQLRHTERLSSIGSISAGIAHELGTPLNVIDGRAKMILTEDLEKEEIIECAGIIRNQAQKITGIIRQLLDYSRIRKPDKTKETIEPLVRQVFRLLSPLAVKQGVELALNVKPGIEPAADIDAAQIQQVLMNLIMNGVQSMTAPGTISVEISVEQIRSTERTDGLKKTFVKIDVSDQGEGIPPSNIEQIFEPFFTTKKIGTGTGLGLSITRDLVEEHGGWVEVRSAPGSGSTFSTYLPSFQENSQ